MSKQQTESRPLARLPSGFQDTLVDEFRARRDMIGKICQVYERFGFAPLETPAVEYLDVLGKFLPEGDQPDAGVFGFRDDDQQWLSLRYDLTAPLARVVAQHAADLPSPYRRYQVGPVWRREKPGPGRFRQFYQCDFDTVGSKSAATDAEVCAVLCAAMKELGIPPDGYTVRVNNRKVLNGVLERAGVTAQDKQSAVLRAVDKLDRLGIDGVWELLGKGRKDPSGDFTPGADLSSRQSEIVLEFVNSGGASATRKEVINRLQKLVGDSAVGKQGVEELAQIDGLLDAMGLSSELVCFDPTVVRGLGYYTGAVFEAVLNFETTDERGAKRAYGSVAGGGRYDDLVKRFTGADVPATGASIGVDRLLAALKSLKLSDRKSVMGPVVVVVLEQGRIVDYQQMVTQLREAGIASELYLGERKFGAQMKYAERRNAPAVVICGSDEFSADEVTIKDMALGSELAEGITDREQRRKAAQKSYPRTEMITGVKKVIERLAVEAGGKG